MKSVEKAQKSENVKTTKKEPCVDPMMLRFYEILGRDPEEGSLEDLKQEINIGLESAGSEMRVSVANLTDWRKRTKSMSFKSFLTLATWLMECKGADERQVTYLMNGYRESVAPPSPDDSHGSGAWRVGDGTPI